MAQACFFFFINHDLKLYLKSELKSLTSTSGVNSSSSMKNIGISITRNIWQNY